MTVITGAYGTSASGTVSYRGSGYYKFPLLKRANEEMILQQYAQMYVLPANATDTARFRRYTALSNDPNELTEGVTPSGKSLTYTDYNAVLRQYGDFVEMSDRLLDMHEDRVMSEASELLGEQAAEMMEIVRFGIALGGSNVYYVGGGSARNTVKTVWNLANQRAVSTALRRQRAKTITRRHKSTADWASEALAASYVAIGHTDLETTIRDMDGFVPVERYGTQDTAGPNEIGKVESVRYVLTTLAPIYDGEGDAVTTEPVKSTGGNADVYPLLILAKDALGFVGFKGQDSIKMIVREPKADSVDKLAQRGHVGWKGYHTGVILNDLWMCRVETAIGA